MKQRRLKRIKMEGVKLYHYTEGVVTLYHDSWDVVPDSDYPPTIDLAEMDTVREVLSEFLTETGLARFEREMREKSSRQ